MELKNFSESLTSGDFDLSKKNSKLLHQNYNTEAATSGTLLSSLKWPLKRLSEHHINKTHKKIACKTSIDILSNRAQLRESSQKLIVKSEAYLEEGIKAANDSDDSSFSEESLEDPNIVSNSKPKFDDIINKYYICSSQNIPGNYDTYITNNLRLIGFFKSIKYFQSSIEKISSNIHQIHKEGLKFSEEKPLLILDLDETLIHSDLDLKWSVHDQYLDTEDGSVIPLNLRPYLFEFLDFCSMYFEMIIFTASCSDYANPIINFIEKDQSYFKYRFYREHCVTYGNLFLKDLSIFGKPLNKTIIVDNNIFSFAHYLRNGVLISSYTNESDDLDLCSLIEYFKTLVSVDDVQVEIEGTFGFNKLLNELKFK